MTEAQYKEAMAHLAAFAEVIKPLGLSDATVQDLEASLRSIRSALIFEVMELV